jgi:hypothetical protein
MQPQRSGLCCAERRRTGDAARALGRAPYAKVWTLRQVASGEHAPEPVLRAA